MTIPTRTQPADPNKFPQLGPLTGRTIHGRYEIGRLRAHEPLFDLYDAHDRRRDVAIAFRAAHNNVTTRRPLVERLIQHFRALMNIQCVNFQTIHDILLETSHLYLIQEALEGPSLIEWVAARGERGFAPEEALAIGDVICHSVTHGHIARLLHGALSPWSIRFAEPIPEADLHRPISLRVGRLFLAGTKQITLKITDYGFLSISSGVGGSNTARRDPAQLEIETAFLPIEQRTGLAPTPRSDIYSIGCLIHYAMCGDPPFHAATRAGSTSSVVGAGAATRIVEGLPEAVEQLLIKALKRNPNERYASTEEMGRNIEAALQYLAAHPPVGPRVLRKPTAHADAPADSTPSTANAADPPSTRMRAAMMAANATNPAHAPTAPPPAPAPAPAPARTAGDVPPTAKLRAVSVPPAAPAPPAEPTPPRPTPAAASDPPSPRHPTSPSTGRPVVLKPGVGSAVRTPANLDRASLKLPELLRISGGSFRQGSEVEEDEKPVHECLLDPFEMAVYPVTNEEYLAFVRATGHAPPRCASAEQIIWVGNEVHPKFFRQPVVHVSWTDATAYCDWLSEITGDRWRLPSEAEWECAARGGHDDWPYPWGEADPTGHAVFGLTWAGPDTIPHVGSFAPNAYGLYDMAGLVAEWCRDFYHRRYYELPEVHEPNPVNEAPSLHRVQRGGSWASPANQLRCAARIKARPDVTHATYGFRVVREVRPGEH